MGLATLPSPSEGVFILLVVNTASLLAVIKELFRIILRSLGIYILSSDTCSGPIAITPVGKTYAQQLVEDFRSWSPTICFKNLNCEDCLELQQECSVCLNHFEQESEVNKLGCGHVFHNVCLEKWLNYSNTTCPLCRTPIMPQDESSSSLDCFYN